MPVRHLRPILRVGQWTSKTYEFTLTEGGENSDRIDLRGAEEVTLSLEHARLNHSPVGYEPCTIVDAENGVVEYNFSVEETSLFGRHYVQFEIDWGGETELVPADGYTWVLDIGQRQGDTSPIVVSKIDADDGIFDTIQASQASIGTLTDDLDANGHRVQNLSDPQHLRDAIPQEYADNIAGENITGLSNPALANFDVNNYDLLNANIVDGEVGQITDVLSTLVDTDELLANLLNDVIIATPEDDLQARLDAASDAGSDRGGLVKLLPDRAGTREYTLDSAPYTIPAGVTVDATGAYMNVPTDTAYVFDLEQRATMNMPGARIFASGLTGHVFRVSSDSTTGPISTDRYAEVFGYPVVQGTDGFAILLEQTGGVGFGMCHFEVGMRNAGGVAEFRSIHPDGWINDNEIRARGSVAATGAKFCEMFSDGGGIRENRVWAEHVQLKPNVETIYHAHTGTSAGNVQRNTIGGWIADGFNASYLAEWGAGVRFENTVYIMYAYARAGIDSGARNISGHVGNTIKTPGKEGGLPQDLAGMEGDKYGDVRYDDGTNMPTADPGPCVWIGDRWAPVQGDANDRFT